MAKPSYKVKVAALIHVECRCSVKIVELIFDGLKLLLRTPLPVKQTCRENIVLTGSVFSKLRIIYFLNVRNLARNIRLIFSLSTTILVSEKSRSDARKFDLLTFSFKVCYLKVFLLKLNYTRLFTL